MQTPVKMNVPHKLWLESQREPGESLADALSRVLLRVGAPAIVKSPRMAPGRKPTARYAAIAALMVGDRLFLPFGHADRAAPIQALNSARRNLKRRYSHDAANIDGVGGLIVRRLPDKAPIVYMDESQLRGRNDPD